MRDIPLFTTQNGVASLYLKKIPFTGEAYIHIRDSDSCEIFLKECADFCRMAGAERILATGHDMLCTYTPICTIWHYSAPKDGLPVTDAIAMPIAREQIGWWRELYNNKMSGIHTAVPLSVSDVEDFVQKSCAYYICRECSVLGIGVAVDGQIQAVASVVSGGGGDIVAALAACIENETVSLSVASTNPKAIALYERLGFVRTEQGITWYMI